MRDNFTQLILKLCTNLNFKPSSNIYSNLTQALFASYRKLKVIYMKQEKGCHKDMSVTSFRLTSLPYKLHRIQDI